MKTTEPKNEVAQTTNTDVATTQTPPPPVKANTAKALFERPEIQNKFQEMLGKRATSFMTSVLQIVSQNALLAKADPVSVYQAAAVAATLDLPLNANLGFAYIVPYNQSFKDGNGAWQKKQVAQFQMGYKGFIQLAQRSGQFKSLYSTPVYEGQIVEANPLDGYVFDFTKAGNGTAVGYAARFKLINGFEATLYMTTAQLKAHGAKYSKTFGNEKGLWNTDFDSMASKTVIKLLLSKYAPLSVDMQKAVIADQSVIKDTENDTIDVEYVDNDEANDDITDEDMLLQFDFNKASLSKEDLALAQRIVDNKERASYPKLAKLLSGSK